MPISTDLNISPYFDDHNPLKDFYKILFKPGVSVQTRELNQLQTIFQTQIERFGDNIFRKGTIINGCNFTFNNAQPYAKILDSEVDGVTSIPSLYIGKFVKNQANLRAYIVNAVDGFEATAPDLKTIYFNYINSGDSSNTSAYAPGQILTVFDPKESIYRISVENGGINFSNVDEVIVSSQISVNVSSGVFTVGDNIVDASPGGVANLEIINVDTNTLSGLGHILLTVKPRATDLANASSNSSNWTITSSTEVRNSTNTAVGIVQRVFGEGASARVTTSGAGTILSVNMLTRGEGYRYTPFVTVKSPTNTTGINAVDLLAKNFVAQLQIDASSDAVGNGYVFGVGEGIIYQKGHFLRVRPQSIIVDKYSSTPNAVSVGFSTDEFIINSNIDTSLLDNALDTENYTAPGADRLKLVPRLQLATKDQAAANANFLTIVEWNDGNPYKQNQITQYSRIGEEIARHTFDSSGSFVLDHFQVVTQSTPNTANEGRFYGIAIDPGQAYIGGNRIQTTSNYKIDVRKGTDTALANNTISLNYGNFLRVRELGGNFLFKVGADVDFYDTPKGFLSNTSLITSGNTDPVGIKIGTAKLRSMLSESDSPGQANSTYRMYLFDIRMESGRNFRDIRSIHFDGTSSSTANGIADSILEVDSSTGRLVSRLRGISNDGLIFSAGVQSLKNSNNTVYTYKTIDPVAETANNGTLVKNISSVSGEFFRDAGALSIFDMRELYVAPVANNLISSSDLTGTVAINTTNNAVIGVGTDFFSDFAEGDFVQFSNGSSTEIKRITSLVSGQELNVDSPFGMTEATATFKRVFPKNVPVPFGYREGLTANVDSTRKVLTLQFAHSNGAFIEFEGNTSTNTAFSYNVRREGVTSSLKTANRKKYLKIRVANSVGQQKGPWSIGVPDVFRLRNVYVANVSTVNTASPNVTDSFFVDHNQNQNYLGISYLYLNNRSGLRLTVDDYLLVEVDHFTKESSGYFDAVSYRRTAEANTIAVNDSTPLANLTDFANSLEIPEVFTSDGQYYDLLNNIDFRPAVANNVALSSDPNTAPINPPETEVFDQTTDKKFPIPDSSCSLTIEHYVGRVDDVYISNKGSIFVLQGIPNTNSRRRQQSNHPKDSLRLQVIEVPPYPSVSEIRSNMVAEILDKKIVNETSLNKRLQIHTTAPLLSTTTVRDMQPHVYTMEDIGALERRIKDLEYYVSLTIMETGITNKVIPSSINPTINRFKFGFFADDFATPLFSDTGNPEYSAAIESEGDEGFGVTISQRDTFVENQIDNKQGTSTPTILNNTRKSTNRITPIKHLWSLDHTDGEKIILDNIPYMDEVAIDQGFATVEPPPPIIIEPMEPDIPVPVIIEEPIFDDFIEEDIDPCIPIRSTNATFITSTNGYYFTRDDNVKRKQKIDVVTFGTLPGTATLYFYMHNGSGSVEVFQGTGTNKILVATTDDTAGQVSALTDADKLFIANEKESASFYSNGVVKFTSLEQVGGKFVRYAGKLQFNHNPANGRDYTIVTTRENAIWRWLLQYPTTSASEADTIVDVEKCGVINPPFSVYNGSMFIESIKSSWSCSSAFKINRVAYGAYLVSCTGLKPNTEHKFYIDGVEHTQVSPQYKGVDPNTWPKDTSFITSSIEAIGRPVVTNEEGKVSFIVYVEITKPLVIDVAITGFGDTVLREDKYRTAAYGSSGYSTLEVRDTNSVAKYIIPDRTPDKIIAGDSRGTV
jgi:hypothetical protein